MTNNDIAEYFALLSKLMTIHDKDEFRAKSYSIAAYNIENLPQPAMNMDDVTLFSMKGIGAGTGARIKEILQTGTLQQLEDLITQTPPGVIEMMQVKGLGPKKIAMVWKELNISTIDELESACMTGRLATVKGLGGKTQQNILEAIAFLKEAKGFYLWATVCGTATGLVNNLRKTYPNNLIELTGGFKRQLETLDKIDIITDLTSEVLFQNIAKIPNVVITAVSDTISTVKIPNQPLIQVYFTTKTQFYKDLFLTSASQEFLDAFHEQYAIPDTLENEEAIFTLNKLAFIPAPLREQASVLQRATQESEIVLIQPHDIKGIIHSHSTWSDGAESIAQMATVARTQGYEYLVISDHSQAAYYARGLKPEQIAAQHKEISALNASNAPFHIFKSIEADILNDGALDYDDAILSSFDLVIASVHSNLKMPLDKAMARIMKAVENPYTSILGHPTGRLLLSREGYPVDHKALIKACASYQVVIEINANPHRLDLDWRWIELALSEGVLLSVNPDAHSTAGFQDVFYGTMVAQKGGLTKEHNLSSYNLEAFKWFVEGQQAKRP